MKELKDIKQRGKIAKKKDEESKIYSLSQNFQKMFSFAALF